MGSSSEWRQSTFVFPGFQNDHYLLLTGSIEMDIPMGCPDRRGSDKLMLWWTRTSPLTAGGDVEAIAPTGRRGCLDYDVMNIAIIIMYAV